MTFSEALNAVKSGKRISRRSWNGKGQFVFLVHGDELWNAINESDKYGENWFPYGADVGGYADYTCSDSLAIKTAGHVIQVGWLATQTDMLANDWYTLEENY